MRAIVIERIQFKRSKSWRMPPVTVKVDRSTIYGNPFTTENREGAEAVALFGEWLTSPTWVADCQQRYLPVLSKHLCEGRTALLAALPKLRGKNLVCWCLLPAEGQEDICHGALLLELANQH
jgi:hypothetical protein